jgi:hypothetical protein
MRLTKEDINFILKCMEWNKYNFEQKMEKDCLDKKGTLERIREIMNKLGKL